MAEDAPAQVAASQDALARIKAAVKAAQDGGAIADKAVDQLATREIERRAKLLVSGMDSLVELTRAFDVVNKPDIEQYEGADQQSMVVRAFSKKRQQEIAAAKKKMAGLAKALDSAITAAQYDQLENQIKSKTTETPPPE